MSKVITEALNKLMNESIDWDVIKQADPQAIEQYKQAQERANKANQNVARYSIELKKVKLSDGSEENEIEVPEGVNKEEAEKAYKEYVAAHNALNSLDRMLDKRSQEGYYDNILFAKQRKDEDVEPETGEDYYEDDVEFDDYNPDDVPEDDTEDLEDIEDSSIEYDAMVPEEDEAVDFLNQLNDDEVDAINELADKYTAGVDNYEELISNAIDQRNELVDSLGYTLKQANWIMLYYLAFKDADEEVKNAIIDTDSIMDEE